MLTPDDVPIVGGGGALDEPVPELGSADVLLGLIATDVSLEHHVAVVRRPDDLPAVLGELVKEIRDLRQTLRCVRDVFTQPARIRALAAVGPIELVADRPEDVDEDVSRCRRHVRILAALLHEAVATVGILGDHDEGTVLEARLTLEGGADQVVVLVLGRHADATFALDLGIETPGADPQRDALAREREQLPSVLCDQDAGLANVLTAKPVAIGGTRNAHVPSIFA